MKQPKRTSESAADKQAAFSSTITRKNEGTKRPRVIKGDFGVTNIESTFEREQNNQKRNQESTPSVIIANPGDRLAYSTEDNVRFLEKEFGPSFKGITQGLDKQYTLIGSENDYDPSFDNLEDSQRAEAYATKNLHSDHGMPYVSNKMISWYKTSNSERTNRNTKTFSDSKTQRQNRGVLGKIKDFLSGNTRTTPSQILDNEDLFEG